MKEKITKEKTYSLCMVFFNIFNSYEVVKKN